MNRIVMTKYGFERWPEEDFSDDGNRFICYRAGKAVRVSKLIANGQAYLSISSDCGRGTLPYETYSKLPHYHDAEWRWNGIPAAGLTDKDLQDFYNACVEYEKEYLAAEAALVYPTLEEIREKAVKITAKSLLELSRIEMLLSKYCLEAAAKFSPYEWKQVQEYIKHLQADVCRFNPEAFPETIVGKSYSFDFVKPDYNMEESYWFKYLNDLFQKYCMTA